MSFYLIKADLIISSSDFDISIVLNKNEKFKNAWKIGELVRPDSSRVFKDSGVRFSLLDEIEEPDWLMLVTSSLHKWVEKFDNILDKIPEPYISICIRTGGTDFPPIYFSKEFLNIVQKIGAVIDVDVISTASLERQEDDKDT